MFQPGGLAENSRWQATRRHRKCDPMGFHPVRRWQKTRIGGWSKVWHPMRGAGCRFATCPGGGERLPPATFWHPHSGYGCGARRLGRPEFVTLCFSPEGWQKIAGGKQRAATGNVIQWDSTPSGGGRKQEAAGGAKSGTPFGVRDAVLPQVPVVARAYHWLFSGTPMRGAGRGRGVFTALSL